MTCSSVSSYQLTVPFIFAFRISVYFYKLLFDSQIDRCFCIGDMGLVHAYHLLLMYEHSTVYFSQQNFLMTLRRVIQFEECIINAIIQH